MGLMQAIDNVRAVKILLDIIKENGYSINEKEYMHMASHMVDTWHTCVMQCGRDYLQES